ncbi:MAG TPA: STAS domain-containing protein [Oceanipulchritudo sp.]|nr:STAS domain-containing protein [Oceanipulchritudo sp.]
MSSESVSNRLEPTSLISGRLDPAKKRLHAEVRDEVTSTQVPTLRQGLKKILESADKEAWDSLFLDMRSTRMVDSMGINWLFAETVRLKDANKKMVVRISSPAINRVMEFAGLDRMVTLKFRRRKQTR